MMYQLKLKSPKQDSMSLWEVTGELVNPMTFLYPQKSKGPIVKVVNGLPTLSTSTCQHPNFRSNAVNNLPHWSNLKSHKSQVVSMHLSPSLHSIFSGLCRMGSSHLSFSPNTSTLTPGLLDILKTATSNTSFRCFLTSL